MFNEERNATLPATIDVVRTPAPAYSIPVYGATEAEASEVSLPLSHYLWLLRRHCWKILAFVGVAMFATLIVTLRLVPIYEATATIDIDRQSPPGVIGQEATRSVLNDADQFLATQIRLIESDSVLRPVVRRFKLPVVDQTTGEEGALRTPAAEDAPIKLKRLKITRPPNTYLLLINYRSPDPKLAADAANAIAQSYIEHTYNLRFRASSSLSQFMEKQIEELRAKMERSTAALAQFERELDVINPEEKTSIVSARLMQLNTEFTNAQADLLRKQAAADSLKSGSLEAGMASSQGESLRKIMERLNEAQERFAQVKTTYGQNHPEFRKSATQVAELQQQLQRMQANIAERVSVEFRESKNREEMLRKALGETKAEFDRLNARSFEYQQLKREADADKKLYEELVRRIKEAGINASFQNSSIRLADAARPALKPVFPSIKLNLLLAFLISTLIAVGAAVVSDVLDNTVRDPDEVVRTLKTSVIGTLPSVKGWRNTFTPLPLNSTEVAVAPKGQNPRELASGFAESVRTLRNSILLTDFDRRVRSMLVTSASPSEGKSTTAAHLAIAHAEQGKRTLLIDGDLRRPSLHRRFGLSVPIGLSSVLLGEISWRDVVVPSEIAPGLDILPAGRPSHRASDLVGSGLAQVIEEASQEYDLVMLDAPPLLGFAEPLQMATLVDGVLVVVRAGETNRKAVGSVLAQLTRLRANVLGLVLNGVTRHMSDSYYYYGYYGKYYTTEHGSKA